MSAKQLLPYIISACLILMLIYLLPRINFLHHLKLNINIMKSGMV